MSGWTRSRFLRWAAWEVVALVVTTGLYVVLREFDWDDCDARTEAKYWCGITCGLIMARYLFWFDEIEEAGRKR